MKLVAFALPIAVFVFCIACAFWGDEAHFQERRRKREEEGD